jgi:hypothetical protein
LDTPLYTKLQFNLPLIQTFYANSGELGLIKPQCQSGIVFALLTIIEETKRITVKGSLMSGDEQASDWITFREV